MLDDGLYATGWFRRGPRGTIPENRAEAQALAARVIADFGDSGPGQAAACADLAAGHGYAGWKRIDAAEIAAAGSGPLPQEDRRPPGHALAGSQQ